MAEDEVELFLVPGFMGFDAVGRLTYFKDIEALFYELGPPGVVWPLRTDPAGNLADRATRIAAQVACLHDPAHTRVTFAAHSTGGLDVRVLCAARGAVRERHHPPR